MEVGEAALEKDAPVPPTCVQVEVTVAPEGSPSSVTVPARVTLLVGSVIVWSAPALTVGAWLVGPPGCTVTTMSSEACSAVSLAVRRSV